MVMEPFNGMGKTGVELGLRGGGGARVQLWKYFEMPISIQVDSSKEKSSREGVDQGRGARELQENKYMVMSQKSSK